jgi:membrane protease YdiL (CAAX protease family)
MEEVDRADAPPVRWGLTDFFVGLVVAYVAVLLLQPLVLAVTGQSSGTDSSQWPLSTHALAQVPFYGAMLATALLVTYRKGRGPVEDLRIRARLIDVPLGLVIGAALQGIGALIYVPIYWITDLSSSDVDKPARELADKAHGAGVLLLIVVVVIAAPIVEEIFYRGLLLRGLERRVGSTWAVVGSAAIFAATHFEALQFPALFLFGLVAGWLAVRFDRLGPSIVAHLAFNATAVFFLLY